MTKPRKRLVSLQDTPYYHCISRCGRRAYLCGVDPNTGFDFSHRRGWIVNRIKQLAGAFAIDVYAYAVMSNRYHIVVKIDAGASIDWTDHEVADRWLGLLESPEIVRRWARGELMGQGEMATVAAFIKEWRRRLADLSWFIPKQTALFHSGFKTTSRWSTGAGGRFAPTNPDTFQPMRRPFWSGWA